MKNFIILIFIVSTGLNNVQAQQKDSCYNFFTTNSAEYVYYKSSTSTSEKFEYKNITRYKNMLTIVKIDSVAKASIGHTLFLQKLRVDLGYGTAYQYSNSKKFNKLFFIIRAYKEEFLNNLMFLDLEGSTLGEFNLATGVYLDKKIELNFFTNQESYGITFKPMILNNNKMRIYNYIKFSCFTKIKKDEAGKSQLDLVKYFVKAGLTISFGG
jgi:hypothetical protein